MAALLLPLFLFAQEAKSPDNEPLQAGVEIDSIASIVPVAPDSSVLMTSDSLVPDSASGKQPKISPKSKRKHNEIVRDKRNSAENKTEVIQTYTGNVNQLRSPKKAFFLSFLIPGLGEYYARGSWWRVSIPLATELSCYAALGIIRSNYNTLTKKYQSYADEYYRHDKLMGWYEALDTTTKKNEQFSHKTTYDEAYRDKTNDYYEMIGKYDMFVQGWNDVAPYMDSAYMAGQYATVANPEDYTGLTGWAVKEVTKDSEGNLDTTWLYYHDAEKKRPRYFGFSANQVSYMSLRDDANSMGDRMLYVFYVMLANRIISAVDAVLATNSVNKKITGNTLSAIERIRVRPAAFGGSELTNGAMLTYHF